MDAHQLEQFALAADRAKALDQLISGTEDHFFHACLVAEQAGDLKHVESLLGQWNKRHGETQLFREIRNRLHLLRYDKDPKGSLEYLRYHLGLQFNHERAAEGREAKHPSRMEDRTVGRDEVKRHGLSSSNSSDLAGFTDAALEWLADEPMDGHRLRSFLGRLQRPDHPRLPEMVAAELKDTRNTGGFGAIPIHGLLLEEQLERLLRLVPALKDDDVFVNARLAKLHPGPDSDWRNVPAEREAFLGRLWEGVKGLTAKFNALKAHVLYHRLDHDRRAGVRDRARFTEYLKLPRQVGYANPDYLKQFKHEEEPFGLGQDFSEATLHASVGDDQELVTDYLAHFFAGAKDWKPFEAWIQADFVKSVFASTKLLLGEGDRAQWTAMLNNPALCQALNDRVEIGFALENRGWFRANDPVTLAVDVKNVPNLTVKVFEINALNWFLATGRDVDTAIDLDGLVAGEEQAHAYAEPPMRRVRRTFALPALAKPGVWVVEFIGGGISSRALVRKGRLRFIERVGASGHVFTVLDEDRNILPDAAIWLGGREYRPEPDGEIHVPFTANPGTQRFLLRHGGITTVEQFEHRAETYRLSAGMHVDRESLLRKKEAQLVVRPSLQVNGVPVALSLLEDPSLLILSADRDGVSSSQEVRGFALHEDRDSVHVFQVPENLASLEIRLTGKVQNLSLGQKQDLADSVSLSLNGVDATAQIEDVHLARTSAGFVVSLLGKSGEPKAGTALNVQFRHRDLVPTLHITLQTDTLGRVELGHLRDIVALTVSSPSGATGTWDLPHDRARLPGAVHVRAGESFRIPFMDAAPQGASAFPDAFGRPAAPDSSLQRSDACLLERLGDGFVRDHFKSLSRRDGFLEVAGLPAGDYLLFLKREAAAITVRAVPGEDRAGWVTGEKRHAERRNPRPLQVSAAAGKDAIRVKVANANDRTRVHVFGTRFVPEYDAFEGLGRAGLPGARTVELAKAPSQYVAGRDIGDEYRYILERRAAKRFAGNMLARPGLLLNPWAVRSTETATQDAATGGMFGASAPPMMAMASAMASEPEGRAQESGGLANLDFLANAAAVLLNLKPDAKGELEIPREAAKHANSVRIVAVDPLNTVCRDLLLPEVSTPHEDLRLRLALDADSHFCEKKQVSVLSPGQPLEIADITTSKTEVYDTLARVFRLYSTLSNNAELAKFSFILQWPRLTEDEKRAKYSEFACHELSFFIAKKDPEWFQRVMKPYLRNKMDRTFLDLWLLEEDLSEFRRPWAFGRLNVVERILLSQRFDDEGDPVARHVRDRFDLLPRDVEGANRLFGSAIAGSALEAGDLLGIGRQAEEMERSAVSKLDKSLAMPMGQARPAPAPPASMAAPKPSRRASGGKAKEAAKKLAGPRDEEEECLSEAAADMPAGGDFDDEGGRSEKDARMRSRMRAFYQKLDKTQEWAENNYWHLPIEQQGPDLVTVNAFWRDYAAHRRQGPFLSRNFAHASRNFTEMMFALSVLDLPFEADQPSVAFEGARMKLSGKAASVAFHREIKPVEPSAERVPVLVSQNYFRDDDRSREENGEQVDKYVSGEFLVNVVYSCQVVLTNPTSTRQKLDLLLQIPTGAVPVRNGFATRGRHVELASYNTESLEYAFYFPAPGTFPHFPVHVARDEQLVASAEPVRLKVVREPSQVDRTSWAWVSQHGSAEDVLKWLDGQNADRVELGLIAWRMKDRGFYEKCLALLARRHIWHPVLWSYAIHHNDLPHLREFLLHQDRFLDQCGLWLKSTPVTIDPVARRRFQHLEYAPLVNARSQKLGARRTILNNRFAEQHQRLMTLLRYRAALSDADRLQVTYALLLQDRVDEALAVFAAVDPGRVSTRLQVDYLKVYADFCREKPADARETALRYKDHPVDRWRNLFRNALAQIDEITGAAVKVVDDRDRDQRQANLAATEPEFEFTVEKKTVAVTARNLSSLSVNYYRMDVELLFSRQPFVQQQSGQFAFIRPNRTDEIRVPAGKNALSFELPAEFHGANVIVELVGAGKRRSQAVYAHELSVAIAENYGQLRVSRQGDGTPLPRTYVKVYARMNGGEVKFYKDGCTDLRGAFDYTSLNTNELDHVERFALLVLSEANGAVIREAGVPKR